MERDEEVRRKPAPQVPVRREPANTGVEDSDYYDILVIGKVGIGKSTTADKLMVPETRVPGNKVEAADREHSIASPGDKQRIKGASFLREQSQNGSDNTLGDYRQNGADNTVGDYRQNGADNTVGDYGLQDASPLEKSMDAHRPNHQAKWEDLTAWVLCDDEEEQRKAEQRLKNIVMCRELNDSHKEVHRLRNLSPELYDNTSACQLLINDKSKVRVLDIPGFHGAKHFEGAGNQTESNLSIVRKIIHIQAMAGVRFRRILYFLPVQVTRDDRNFQSDVSPMVRYFNKSIFKCMVLVTTVSEELSDLEQVSRNTKFPENKLARSQHFFQEVLEREFRESNRDASDLPKPPIISIATTDTCEDILDAVMSAPVESDEGLQLEISRAVCSRCDMTIGIKRTPEGENIPMACALNQDWSEAIPYSESTCHPKLLPRYTIRSIGKGIVDYFRGNNWCFTEEKCINSKCKENPGTRGCKKVYTRFERRGHDDIIVNHTYELDESEEPNDEAQETD